MKRNVGQSTGQWRGGSDPHLSWESPPPRLGTRSSIHGKGEQHAAVQTTHESRESVCHICRLQEPNRDALVLYARLISDTADYVLNQIIDTTIAKDRDPVALRAEHPMRRRPGRMASTGRPESAHRLTIGGETVVRRVVVEYRFVISLALAGIMGAAGLGVWPFPSDHPLLQLIAAHRPMIYLSGIPVRIRDRLVAHHSC
jgi:hypothetical protein